MFKFLIEVLAIYWFLWKNLKLLFFWW
jgi:hypothetical protein